MTRTMRDETKESDREIDVTHRGIDFGLLSRAKYTIYVATMPVFTLNGMYQHVH